MLGIHQRDNKTDGLKTKLPVPGESISLHEKLILIRLQKGSQALSAVLANTSDSG